VPYRLLNVEDAVRTRNGLRVEPGIRLRALLRRISDQDVPLPGDLLEIRFPDGGENRVHVAAFGWEGLESGGAMYLNPDPTDPKFNLVIAGDLSPTAVPRGSEIWLVDYGPARRWDAGRGWGLLAQMALPPKEPVVPPATAELPISPLIDPPTGSALDLVLGLAPDPTINPAVDPEIDPQIDSAISPAISPESDPAIEPLLRPRKNRRRFWWR
jgi:hypothetical protein